ncbi:hypothetical protein LSH36_568g02037 [Paralvinella palmiformis]|uniref:Reelin domain-containing protein n=1 Tax=Paralvinella palmiformis TaxID=53620 RepID=A0AAD9MVB4_9ANNE|nr:hypothetical protein LSH36_568g02037 [Paralvinella palmiformis]
MRPVLFITCVLFVCHPVCDGYSEGAPVEACTALKPLHDSEPETRETPYTFTAYHDFVDDQTPIVNVTILGSDRVWFKGFLLQARDNNNDLIGEFIDHRDNSIFVECSEHDPRSSVTQKRAFPKKSVNFIWKPPVGYTGKVTFR